MEYIWYLIAASGAGIGTGLAGLSAATVMVPILIVLCPSFSGEYGAYQATAIALASDILGSAVTATVYARNNKLDLKHGWVLFACIISLSTVGSYVAYLAGNVVLGGFTLFLTFCIGIRFLVKPDTSRQGSDGEIKHLGLREILISVFFGLTIGFGTGFVGTGGGMMMLVVFTVFLGYDLKTAVGTSTFIMTFTALIGFISHSLIHPAIVIKRWDVLILCMITATVASLISAQFANRVSNRTVGLTTGVILTLLGATMIWLQYFREMVVPAVVTEFFTVFSTMVLFLVIAVAAALIVFFRLGIRGELRRKILHTIAFLLVLLLVYIGEHWYVPTTICLAFAGVVYPVLYVLERHPQYAGLLQERSPGEIRSSLLLLFGMAAVLITVFWGYLGVPVVIFAGVLGWGLGDEAAALVGKRFGRHKLCFPLVDRKKSLEGSAAMFLIAFLAMALTLLYYAITPIVAVIAGGSAAILATLVEAVTRKGYDTVSVPCATALMLWIVLTAFGAI